MNDDDTRGPRERAYDEHVAPLMGQIIELCKQHGIPMLASYALDFAEEHGSDLHCTTYLVNGDNMKPGDDRLQRARAILKPAPAQWAAYTIHSDGTREKVAGSDDD